MSGRTAAALLVATLVSVLVASPGSAVSYDPTSAVPAWRTDGTGIVRDITTIGSTVYVAGSFQGLRADGQAGVVAQPYLAAFDESTGELLASFAPDLDGEVWALQPSPDGTVLFVGGAFRNVDGVARTGLVALDPATGVTIAGFPTAANNDVIDLDADGTHLYLAGRFSAVGGVPREKVARVDLATGAVDPGWAPMALGGKALAVDVEPSTDRVYVGGDFASVDAVAGSGHFAALSRLDGSVVASLDPDISIEVYDIAATPSKVYVALGGPGGRLDIYDAVNGLRRASWSTDGDAQEIELAGDRVYVGGHHEVGFGPISSAWVTEIDATTDVPRASFDPDLAMTVGFGVWGLHATDEHLWVGGALTSAAPVAAVGFARFPTLPVGPPDTVPPPAPAGPVAIQVSDVSVSIAWDPVIDAEGTVGYLVERDGVIHAASAAPEFVDPLVAPATSYSYRVLAIDEAGNLSPASASLPVTTSPVLEPVTVIGAGAVWAHRDDGLAPPPGWNQPGFDDVGWPRGPAQLGVGDGDEATTITNRRAVFLRHEVELPPGRAVGVADLQLLVDDGAVVYVNGVEALRDNMPAGVVTHTTPATTPIAGVFETGFRVLPLDPTLFVEGTNTIAVSVHNVPGSIDLSFDARLRLRLAPPTCNGLPVTVDLGAGQQPTSGADVIIGTNGADTISGLGGADVICGAGGDDTIAGGPGDDSILAGDGDDTVFGGTGADTVVAAGGDDTVQGNVGIDTIDGGAGADVVSGNEDGDLIAGGAGADTLYGAVGDDSIVGDAGDDTILGGLGADTIDAGAGADLVSGNGGADTVGGDEGDDTLYGVDGNDAIDGGPGADTILGGPGDDAISGADGIDLLSGNDGADQVLGGADADTIYGVDGDDDIDAGPGDDLVLGGAGADTILGGDGIDLLSGNDGADQVGGDAGDDEIYGAADPDELTGGPGLDVILGGAGDDAVDALDGEADQVSGNAGVDRCAADLALDAVFGCESPLL